MKLFKFTLALFSVAAVLSLTNCGSDKKTTVSPADQQLAKLTKTWKFKSVKLNDTEVTTPSYAGFELIFTGSPGTNSFGYNTNGRPSLSPWKSSGTWSFVSGNEQTSMTRDGGSATDKLDITYSLGNSDKTLELNFTYSGPGYPNTGRTDQVNGRWVFTLTTQ